MAKGKFIDYSLPIALNDVLQYVNGNYQPKWYNILRKTLGQVAGVDKNTHKKSNES